MNLKIITLTLIIFIGNAYAEEHVFKISGSKLKFKAIDSVLYNLECAKGCIAQERVNQIKSINLKMNKEKYSMSLGAYICKNILLGKSVLGVNKSKDMRDFCFFSEDKSLIEINSLSEYGHKLLKSIQQKSK